MQDREDDSQNGGAGRSKNEIIRMHRHAANAPGPHQRQLKHLLRMPEGDTENGAKDEGKADRGHEQRHVGALRELPEDQPIAKKAHDCAASAPVRPPTSREFVARWPKSAP